MDSENKPNSKGVQDEPDDKDEIDDHVVGKGSELKQSLEKLRKNFHAIIAQIAQTKKAYEELRSWDRVEDDIRQCISEAEKTAVQSQNEFSLGKVKPKGEDAARSILKRLGREMEFYDHYIKTVEDAYSLYVAFEKNCTEGDSEAIERTAKKIPQIYRLLHGIQEKFANVEAEADPGTEKVIRAWKAEFWYCTQNTELITQLRKAEDIFHLYYMSVVVNTPGHNVQERKPHEKNKNLRSAAQNRPLVAENNNNNETYLEYGKQENGHLDHHHHHRHQHHDNYARDEFQTAVSESQQHHQHHHQQHHQQPQPQPQPQPPQTQQLHSKTHDEASSLSLLSSSSSSSPLLDQILLHPTGLFAAVAGVAGLSGGVSALCSAFVLKRLLASAGISSSFSLSRAY